MVYHGRCDNCDVDCCYYTRYTSFLYDNVTAVFSATTEISFLIPNHFVEL